MNSLIVQSFKPNQISWGTDVAEDVQLDEEKLKEALKKQKDFEAQAVETNERKRKYNSFKDDGAAPTEEEVRVGPCSCTLPNSGCRQLCPVFGHVCQACCSSSPHFPGVAVPSRRNPQSWDSL